MALILTDLDPTHVAETPDCICGKDNMVNMNSDEYAYGNI